MKFGLRVHNPYEEVDAPRHRPRHRHDPREHIGENMDTEHWDGAGRGGEAEWDGWMG